MKILFYTRFENNTGGDETLLRIIQFHLFEVINNTHEIHLCISHDPVSKERAQKFQYKWYEMLFRHNLDGHVWLFSTAESSLEKSIPGVIYKYWDAGKNSIDAVSGCNTLDSKITWYIKAANSFYIFRKDSHEKEHLIPQNQNALSQLHSFDTKACYITLEAKQSNQNHYPLYVLSSDSVAYYATPDATPKIFSRESAPKKQLKQLEEKILRNKGKPTKLSNDELKIMTSFTCYIPDEVLMTKEEQSLLETSFCIPKKLKKEKKTWQDFTNLVQSIDCFLMAGWANLQNRATARYLKETLKIVPTCKIVLTCAPGLSINAYGFLTGLQEQGYLHVYVLQPGIGSEGGFPLLPSLTQEDIKQDQTRLKWLSHIEACHLSDHMDPIGQPRQDKIIVIYTSKDGPGLSGTKFLQDIAEACNPAAYPVLLIGADPNSNNFKQWKKQCDLRGFQSCHVVKRTENSSILMRALRDAEFSMATGAFSILEARYLGINHCQYLCPPHMIQLGTMLSEASETAIQNAFINAQASLKKFALFLIESYHAESFEAKKAWHKTDSSEWRTAWQTYLVAANASSASIQNEMNKESVIKSEAEEKISFLPSANLS